MGLESLGDLTVTSGVDTSGLSQGLDSAVSTVQQAANQMAGAMGTAQDATEKLGDSFGSIPAPADQFSAAAQKIIDTQDRLQTRVETLQGALEELQQGYDNGTVSAEALQRAQDQLEAAMAKANLTLEDPAPEEAASNFDKLLESIESNMAPIQGLVGAVAALGEAFVITETVKEFVTETLGAYDAVQKATNAITALTGSSESAKEVLEGVEQIAQTQPFAFPEIATVAQRMAAFHIQADTIPSLLQDIGNASRATGNDFDAIASAVERVALSGQISARQLVQLGVSWGDLAQAAGVSIAEVQELVKKGGQSAEADLELLQKAMENTSGVMQDVPLSVGEQWQVLQNDLHVIYSDIGAGLAGMATGIVGVVKSTLIPIASDMAAAFKESGQEVSNFFSAISNSGGQITDAIAKLTGLDMALNKLRATADTGIKWTDLLPGVQFANALQGMADTLNSVFPQVVTNFQKVAQAENLAVAAGTTWSEGTKEYIDKAQDQINTVKNLSLIVDELRSKQDGNATSALALAEAQKSLQKAQDDLAKSGGALVKSVSDLTLASDQATAKVTAAQTVYDAIKQRYDQGAASALALAEAHKQLQEAIQAANQGVNSIQGSETALIDKQNQLEEVAKNNVQVYLDLAKTYETGAPVMQKAMDAVVSSMKAAGLELDDLKLKPDAFSTEVVKSGKVVQGAVQDLQTQLEALANAMTDDGQAATDSGAKTLSAVQATAQGVKVFGDTTDATNTALTSLFQDGSTGGQDFANALMNTTIPAVKAMASQINVNGQAVQEFGSQTDTVTSSAGASWTTLKGKITPVTQAINDSTTATQQMSASAADLSQQLAAGFSTATDDVVSFTDQCEAAMEAMQQLADMGSSFGSTMTKSTRGAGGGGFSVGGQSGAGNFNDSQALIESAMTMLADAGWAIGPTPEQINQALMAAMDAQVSYNASHSTSTSSTATKSTTTTGSAPKTTSTTAASTSSTGNPLLDFLNSFTTAITSANSAIAASSGGTVPDWIAQLSTAMQSLTDSTTGATGTTSLPEWVQQLSDTIQQFTQPGQGVVDLTQLGSAIQGVLSQIPQTTQAVDQISQVQQAVTNSMGPLGDLSDSITSLGQTAQAAAEALSGPSFQQTSLDTNAVQQTIGALTSGAAGFAQTALPNLTSGNYAYPGMPGYVLPTIPSTYGPILDNTMSQVTNSSTSSQAVNIGTLSVTGQDAMTLMKTLAPLLQRVGVRF